MQHGLGTVTLAKRLSLWKIVNFLRSTGETSLALQVGKWQKWKKRNQNLPFYLQKATFASYTYFTIVDNNFETAS